jgi:hypothetical protein
MRKVEIIGALSMLLVAFTASAALAISAHEVPSNPVQCVLNPDQTVTCTGSVAGLGNAEFVDITLDVDFACEVRPGVNRPGGHLQDVERDVPVKAGRVNIDETTGPAECPRGLNPVVGPTATVTVTDAETGEELFTKTVTIQGV